MKIRVLAGLTVLLVVALCEPRVFHAQSATERTDPYLTAHEWGTFTSIAGSDGHAMQWLPLTGSVDLPSFVEHFSGVAFKGGLLGTVRMETPVLYFYTNRETTVSVRVSFSKGLITDWYPSASNVFPISAVAPKYAKFSDWSLYQKHPDGSIAWNSVELQPRNSADLPQENRANHYYAARQTSSTALQVKTAKGPQTEKFLFYRGVSTFSVPVSTAIHADGSVLAENLSSEAIPAMLLFERRGDRLGFRVAQQPGDSLALNPPELNGDMDSLKQTVVDMLVAQGLYQDEATAMFETWRNSWFEEGSRLLYIVPRAFVDSILPLTINPAPAQTVRVFVGRVELVTPATLRTVEQAFASQDRATLARYGRFLLPILQVIVSNAKERMEPGQIDAYYSTAYSLQPAQSAEERRQE